MSAKTTNSTSSFFLLITIILCTAILSFFLAIGSILYWQKQGQLNPYLSSDKKSIMSDNKILLSIDDDAIFNFFKTPNQPCYESGGADVVTEYCTDKAIFRSKTRFESIVVSPDKKTVGFSIETDVIMPDTAVGLFNATQQTNNVHFFTDIYLGNVFLNFSPSGKYFVYKGKCWEAMCGLYIHNTKTLEIIKKLNSPQYVDERTQDATFIRWVTDSILEYELTNQSAIRTKEKVSL
jgi:hypothetical protein